MRDENKRGKRPPLRQALAIIHGLNGQKRIWFQQTLFVDLQLIELEASTEGRHIEPFNIILNRISGGQSIEGNDTAAGNEQLFCLLNQIVAGSVVLFRFNLCDKFIIFRAIPDAVVVVTAGDEVLEGVFSEREAERLIAKIS